MPAMPGLSGNFGTTGAVCYFVEGVIDGWGCANETGRTVTVNGVGVNCAQMPLPAPLDGGHYFAFSAGMYDYAAFYWY
jgi:hypothetical protein